MTKITPKIEEQIIRLRNDGLSIDKIASFIGVGNTTIQRIFNKHSISRMTKINEEVAQQILNYTYQGKYPPEIGRILGLNTSTVNRFLKKQNLPKIGASYTGGLGKDIEQQIIDLTSQGFGRRKVASMLGVREDAVRSFLGKINVKSDNISSTTKITPGMSAQIFQ